MGVRIDGEASIKRCCVVYIRCMYVGIQLALCRRLLSAERSLLGCGASGNNESVVKTVGPKMVRWRSIKKKGAELTIRLSTFWMSSSSGWPVVDSFSYWLLKVV